MKFLFHIHGLLSNCRATTMIGKEAGKRGETGIKQDRPM